MALIDLSNVSLAFGGPALLKQVSFRVHPGERVCLVGRNGAGKSTLLKILADKVNPDSGEISRATGLSVGHLPQNVPAGFSGLVYDVCAKGLGETGALLTKLFHGKGGQSLANQENEQEIWLVEHQLQSIISKLGLNPNAEVENLSGGMKRRALLARALACQPDLLLLDEPTNHLDIETIAWLESFLLQFGGAMVFVSHDRAFARNLATRVVEPDRGDLYDWNCPFDQFLLRREEALTTENEQRAKFDKKMAEEEKWLSGGLKARRTRNEGRVRRLMEMRHIRSQRREVLGSAKMKAQAAGLSGKTVAEAQGVEFGYGPEAVIRDFNTIILRGDKVGIIGPNGSGKTTLLNVLLGSLAPRKGQVKLGMNLEVAYFDQMRAELDNEKTVIENIADGHDTLIINGHQRHVISYLKDFLFTADRARSPVHVLSGGERNRLLLAKLFSKPANLLVLDEPTNDLDFDTLELLENLLVEFEGTVLLVSHDRQFLNNVVACTLALETGGVVREYAGGYDDWLSQRQAAPGAKPVKSAKPAKPKQKPQKDQPRKLSFNEKRELAQLPETIETLEAEQAELHQKVADPELYASNAKAAADIAKRLEAIEAELESAYARWEELEALTQ